MTTIYWFKLSNDISEMVTSFAKIHQFDDRKRTKKLFEDWCKDNNETINREVRRLTDIGYDGDVLDKMYKADVTISELKTRKKKGTKAKTCYISMNTEVLDAMDEHIKQNVDNNDYSPANGFDSFCKSNTNIWLQKLGVFVQKMKTSMQKC